MSKKGLCDQDLDSEGVLPLPDETAQQAGADQAEANTSRSLPVFHSDVVPARRSLVVSGSIENIHEALTTATATEDPPNLVEESMQSPDSSSPDLDLHDFSVLRHEIANPLTYLANASTIMRREIANHNCPKSEKLQGMLDTIDHAANQILGIIDCASKQPSDLPPHNPSENPAFKKIHISDLVKTLSRSWSFMAATEGISFQEEIDEGVYVAGNNVGLYEVLTNLVTNAIEVLTIEAEKRKIEAKKCNEPQPAFSPSIVVQLRVHPTIKGLVQLFVQDNGPGIPNDQRHKIFTKNFTGKGGHGIGLWRSKKIVKEMGGHLDLVNNCEREDLEGHENMPGATAIAELPVYEFPVAGSSPGNDEEPDSAGGPEISD